MSRPLTPPRRPAKANMKWNKAEKDYVAWMAQHGKDSKEIQEKLPWRTTDAIYSQANRLVASNNKQNQLEKQMEKDAPGILQEKRARVPSQKVMEIMDKASRTKRMREELEREAMLHEDEEEEEEEVLVFGPAPERKPAQSKPPQPPPLPVSDPGSSIVPSNLFGAFYQIYRPEVQTFYIIINRSPEMKFKVTRLSTHTLSVSIRFTFDDMALVNLVTAVGQNIEFLRHNLPEQTCTKIFTCPFPIGPIHLPLRLPIAIDVPFQNFIVIRVSPPISDGLLEC